MSEYDDWLANNPQAGAQPTVNSALRLAMNLEIDFDEVDMRGPPTRISRLAIAPAGFPAYDPRATNGATKWYLPAHVANPAPVADQAIHTSGHTYDMFSEIDLPPLLFRLEPYPDTVKDIPVPELCTSDGQNVRNSRGDQLRYFSFLPRYISRHVPGWLLEFWFRLDYRLKNSDITERIEEGPGQPVPKNNALNMKRTRIRKKLRTFAWVSSRLWASKGDLGVVGKLDTLSICFNTSMAVDIAGGRLIKPAFNNAMCKQEHIIGWVETGLPVDYFLRNVVGAVPSRRMCGVLALRKRCQELAIRKGLPTSAKNYKLLPDADQPTWWNDRGPGGRVAGRTIDELRPAMTHEEFMTAIIGRDQAVGVSHR